MSVGELITNQVYLLDMSVFRGSDCCLFMSLWCENELSKMK